MTDRRPLVIKDGDVAQLPAADSFAGWGALTAPSIGNIDSLTTPAGVYLAVSGVDSGTFPSGASSTRGLVVVHRANQGSTNVVLQTYIVADLSGSYVEQFYRVGVTAIGFAPWSQNWNEQILPISAFSKTLLDDTDAAAWRTSLDTINADHLTAGTLPDARISKAGPTTPTFSNSFTDAGYCRYWKVGGIVYVQVNVNRTTVPTTTPLTMFTLPSGYRPPGDLLVSASFGQTTPLVIGPGRIIVTTTGAVRYQYAIGSTGGSSGFAMSALFSFPVA